MKEVIKLDTVDQYNRLFGLETLHPLVSVVNPVSYTHLTLPTILLV